MQRQMSGQFHLHVTIMSPCFSRSCRLTLRSRKLWKRNPTLSLFQPQQCFGETGHAVFHKPVYIVQGWSGEGTCHVRNHAFVSIHSRVRCCRMLKQRTPTSSLDLLLCCLLYRLHQIHLHQSHQRRFKKTNLQRERERERERHDHICTPVFQWYCG